MPHRTSSQSSSTPILFSFLFLFGSALVTATPYPVGGVELNKRQSSIPGNQCPTTPLCCANMVEATSQYGLGILALLAYPVVPGTYVAGGCLLITSYGASNTVCPTPYPPLCCGKDEANGYVVADCVLAIY